MMWIALSKIGKLRIGGESAKPEYIRFAWCSMLFAVGKGIGLMYFAGLKYLFNIELSVGLQVSIIAVITCISTLLIVSGIGKGVRLLSDWNIRLAIFLMVYVFILGNTGEILKDISVAAPVYLKDFLIINPKAYLTDTEWSKAQKVFICES
ncbi:BCCT family transporter [uncultured Ilyobacter sp.]|uniref:BCCT family transporter n=1 Tax=uncultured Ilyobacter sp. TaxID=544433 RepID=UPI0029C6F7D4|nr:BCCT family transporter [uncultured Ilyobacter sp.]